VQALVHPRRITHVNKVMRLRISQAMNLQFLIVRKENYYGVGPGSELGDDDHVPPERMAGLKEMTLDAGKNF
jgi:hypothetical protein